MNGMTWFAIGAGLAFAANMGWFGVVDTLRQFWREARDERSSGAGQRDRDAA